MGVKSLWQLLTPVGRPIMLETVEGKVMAIDSSIWIYQFQATMRDKEGRGLVNAHVLGFLRRISKLLFYGIKPVFVFDGGAPALKRSTITERKKKKSGAAASHLKVAEKLLAAQLRREAVSQAQERQASAKGSKGKGKLPTGPVTLDDNTVYLEDIDGSAPRTPAPKPKAVDPSSSSAKKNRFHDHDPYRLPDVDLEEAVAKATRTAVPDPRLATEDELQAFIEEMRPEDFDVTSPAFRELPTEVQYEIVGDMRLKSRQTSYKRLQHMLRNAPTPLDFSKQQILNLKQRNSLTQQLLMTTDSIGKAHVSIPVRIASERNKQYVLMKNEGEGGGWILGIRDEGTQAKPIEIDQDERPAPLPVENDDSDADMEEVPTEGPTFDPDLREYQQSNALAGIARRQAKGGRRGVFSQTNVPPEASPLFDLEDDEVDHFASTAQSDEDDDMLAIAISESLEPHKREPFTHIAEVSGSGTRRTQPAEPQTPLPAPPRTPLKPTLPHSTSSTSRPAPDREQFATPGRLHIALNIAGAGPKPRVVSQSPQQPPSHSVFGVPTLLNSPANDSITAVLPSHEMLDDASRSSTISTAVDRFTPEARLVHDEVEPTAVSQDEHEEPVVSPRDTPLDDTTQKEGGDLAVPAAVQEESSDDDDMEEVVFTAVSRGPSPEAQLASPKPESTGVDYDLHDGSGGLSPDSPAESHRPYEAVDTDEEATTLHLLEEPTILSNPKSHDESIPVDLDVLEKLDSDSEGEHWSRSSSPAAGPSGLKASPPPTQYWDAAEEVDTVAEEGEFANFMSQVKGRDLEDVRQEIDDEIKSLHQQRKAAMRDSEDITQQMISQIMLMLRLFGIPYITAPMEAEAQCAELVSLGLVEGIITDDSDVFLFGGQRVFKNMFNQSKTVECFLLSDLSRELGLDRDTLVRLAYLLGSDYVEGLPGVGPVVAMELLKEFPGQDGLHKFKDWWLKVQTGKDKPEDGKSKFRERFKKKFKDLYLPPDWPNAAVRDAYYHPTVDSSEEPFKWGLPDLDALRHFFNQELGWNQNKVDELLLPIIQKMGKRKQAAALNKQGNLNEFFDVSAGTGAYAPRKKQAYNSKRLQQVVSDFRNQQKGNARVSTTPAPASSAAGSGEDDEPPKKKRKARSKASEGGGRGARGRGRGRGRGGAPGGKRRKLKSPSLVRTNGSASSGEEDAFDGDSASAGAVPPPPLRVALRPRSKPRPAYRGKEGANGDEELDEDAGSENE